MTIQKIKAGRIPGQSADTYVGNDGQLFYDEDDGILRISDGTTPGGTVLSGGAGSSNYTLPTATTTVKGGIKIDGTTIAISNQVISVGTVPYSSLSGAPTVPTNVSQLTNDTGFITGVTWDAVTSKPILFSGAYADLTGKPTNVSSFTNDSGYLTSGSLSSYATQSYVTSRGYVTSTSIPTVVSQLSNDSNFLVQNNFDLNTINLDSNSKLHATGILPGDTEGFTAVFAGRAAGVSALPNTVIQSQAQVNDYAQNNFQNTSDGVHASTEWVATSPNGDDSNYYIDLGINGASWDGTAENSLYANVGQRDGWLYVQGGNAGGGNLVLGTSLANTYTKIIAGNAATGDREVIRFSSTEVKLKKQLTFNDNTTQTTAWTGTLSYTSLTDKPTLVTSYNQLTDLPTLITSYNELANRPTLFSGSYTDLTNKPTLFSGSYNDLTDKPSAPTINLNDLTDVDLTTPPTAGQVLKYDGTKWAAGTDITTGGAGTDADTLSGQPASYYLNYSNLTNKPTIPTTVTVNGTAITLGSSGTVTANTNNALTIGRGLTGTSSTFDGSAANTIALDTSVTAVTATAGATTTLSAATLTRYYQVTGSISGTHIFRLPDLTTLTAGQQITFFTSTATITFQLSSGTQIFSNSIATARQTTFTVVSTASNATANLSYTQVVSGLTGTGTSLVTSGGSVSLLYIQGSLDSTVTATAYQSTPTLTIGAGSNTFNQTINIANVASNATYTKTLNLGTNLNGGTSTINIGTGVTSGTATVNIGSSTSTVQMNGAVTITSLTATNSIVGSVTGNAATATKLGTARTINNVSFDGSAGITITATTPNYLSLGNGLTGTSAVFDGSSAVTIAIDQTVALKADTHYIGTTSIALNRTSASQTLTGVSIDGNAATVTNGVYTSGTYSNPAWITTLAYSKLTGTPTLFSGAYADLTGKPTIYSSAYIGTTSLDFTRASASQTLTGVSIDGNAATVTNGLYSTGSYANPAWLTSLAYSKLTGAPAVPTNVSQLTNDSGYATLTGAETLTNKTLTLPTMGGTGATFNGSTSGTTVLKASATAGTTTITLPPRTGTVITSGDTGTVTNAMLEGNIANAKLFNSVVTIGSTVVALGTTTANLEGLNSVTATNFIGNASTATKLATARAINGTNFDGTAAITITAANPNALTIGTGLSGTSYTGGSAVTIAIDSTVATLTGSQTLTNKTLTLPTIGGTGATFNGSTSGTTVMKASAAAGTTTVTMPATTGTLITTGDSGTVTNTMLAGSIANNKLANSAVTVNGTSISLGSSATIEVNSIKASGFTSSLGFDSAGDLILSNTTTIRSPSGLTLQTGGPAPFYSWAFSNSGNLTFPDATVQSTAWLGTAAAGTLTGTTLKSTVVSSSLTSVGTLNGLTVSKSTSGTALSITASNAGAYGGTATWQFVGNGNIGGAGSWIQFPDSSIQSTAYTGNAATVTNGVYTTDTGTVTNTMLAGSIANNKLANSSITVNGTSISLGSSGTVTAAAGTLTGTTLNSTVVTSSLTSVGTLNGVTSNNANAFVAGDSAISNVALSIPRDAGIRDRTNGASSIYFDVSNGGSTHGSFQFRSSNAFTNVLTMSPTAFNVNPDAVVTARTPSFGRTAWNAPIDTELTIDDYRFRVSNSGGIFPQVISNVSGQTKNSAWTVVAARSGSAISQAGSTGNLVPNNAWVSLYTFAGMDSAGDTFTATLQDKNLGRIYRVTFMRSDNGSTTGYNIIAERLL